MQMIKIGVIIDWKRCQRGNSWTTLLKSLSPQGKFEVVDFRLAELIMNPAAGRGINGLDALKDQKVLIFNWDVINGDPDFGAHLAQMWIRHHRPELLLWVQKGNVLIIESQTRFGVPCQPAYDAAVGEGELPVLPLEYFERVSTIEALHGEQCKHTSHFPKRNGFHQVDNPLKVVKLTDEEPFAATATVFLTEELRDLKPYTLYRGWFRRKLPWRGHLDWVSLTRTTDRGWLRNHSTLQVARHGDGAIFVSTMMLAATGQRKLVEAMLLCVEGKTEHLPKPKTVSEKFRRVIRATASALAGLAFFAASGLFSDVVTFFETHFNLGSSESNLFIKGVFGAVFVSSVALVFDLLYQVWQIVWKNGRRVVGYY